MAIQFNSKTLQPNRLIPHNFGMKAPPLIDSTELLTEKIAMIEALLDMEIAASMLKEGDQGSVDDPIESNYKKLNTAMEAVDKTEEEWDIVQKYLTQTHCPSHTDYSMELVDLFRVSRQGEKEKYTPNSTLHNRMLLWHGSRLTNFVGILSQGLRIAPPEAPVTGYMVHHHPLAHAHIDY